MPTAVRERAGPILVALAATLATFFTLVPDRGRGPLRWGPGVTCDELYHVGAGKRLVHALRTQGWKFFTPDHIAQNFPWLPDSPPVHPPLGNWLLGWMHHLVDRQPDELVSLSVVAPRFVPALAFGLLVLLVGLGVARAEGTLAGTAAAAGVALVPRVFGHAHLAALDMLITFWFVAAVLAVIWADVRGGRWWQYLIAGVTWGLAMLTKLHGVLVLPPVLVWMVWRLRWRVLVPLAAWLVGGMATLFAGWPWLWLDPIRHLRQFLFTATGRQPIQVFYLGQIWQDRMVPWHYAPVMFVVTLPLGLLALGLLGIWARGRARSGNPGYWLAMGSWAFVLAAFCLPGRPVYDGVRLFLMAFPLWAFSVGVGAKWLVEGPLLRRWSYPVRASLLGVFLAGQAVGLVLYHPCYLSHYSALVGGLPGAEKLGFEVSYWGDSVTGDLLAELARLAADQRVLFGPSLARWQAASVGLSSVALEEARVLLFGWEKGLPAELARCRYAVLYRRKANLDDLPERVRKANVPSNVVKQRSVHGVWLARVIEIPIFGG
ncbi:MAG: ArnT family glycosyltransferase [Thermoguttaceae bacterium]